MLNTLPRKLVSDLILIVSAASVGNIMAHLGIQPGSARS
jgi:hypothetical protein